MYVCQKILDIAVTSTKNCSTQGLPVTLIGPPMPHALSKTESYMGYTLPEGAAIINCV